jgi:hypothetical protein
MSYYAQIEAEIREHLLRVIEIVRPYARSTGKFHNREDLRTAVHRRRFRLSAPSCWQITSCRHNRSAGENRQGPIGPVDGTGEGSALPSFKRLVASPATGRYNGRNVPIAGVSNGLTLEPKNG